ncbi:MAG: recombination factor protein RarA [Hydrogenophilales bacterium 16-64-46]|nr:MAG: recombination factor protein RarA [Hydrogenophilales bacterium 12-64-13]OYZ04665.1 MAG: recombination factor protein RarA [Hydrogenophilales bacterium 16-64-46]OZA38351.1 MAG: recombination factor protein RarA [Hydrogenophilales bacterium 17-64-34]HQS99706.1 replication-associated recombination protein A [Thiobacillus sp.]
MCPADLFSDDASPAGPPGTAPLAERLRPRSLVEVVGQTHLLGAGRPLRLAFESGKLHSMILWGPPGVGKTTLARLTAQAFAADFIALSAVLAGVKDIREAVERARMNQSRGRATIVFVDEVHRFNKAQQDAFLPHVESGLFTFIGATTENPSFEVVGALLSRTQVYVLKPLSQGELAGLLQRARSELPDLHLDEGVDRLLAACADGDARKLLNLLEQIATAAQAAGVWQVDAGFVESVLAQSLRRFDKGGDAFYDQISALHKSVRGSSPDAALYWLVRMFDGGADPRYLGRRLVRMASEDIGLADPRALRLALDAVETYERLGSPEGELALAEACLYLACAPKSNAVYAAYNAARAFVRDHPSSDVPLHLRNAPTHLMQELGHGRAYRYAHDEPEAYAAGERYFPDDLAAQSFYVPTTRGLESRIAERLDHLRQLDRQAGKPD